MSKTKNLAGQEKFKQLAYLFSLFPEGVHCRSSLLPLEIRQALVNRSDHEKVTPCRVSYQNVYYHTHEYGDGTSRGIWTMGCNNLPGVDGCAGLFKGTFTPDNFW